MGTNHPCASAKAAVLAVLRGGPADIAAEQRTVYTTIDTHKIKVAHRGGYEHFERDGAGLDGDDRDGNPRPVVFRWTSRTRMAE